MPMRRVMRWTAYAGVSTALAGGVVLKALAQRPNFYSATVYLSQSSANLMILTNMVFMLACAFLFGLQKLLYGPLRPIEIEQLYEKGWFAVTETCLAMTIFRGEIGAWFLVMFFTLLAGKVWQWIGEGRVETLEQQPPRNPALFHTRLALSLGISVFFDLTMLEYVAKQVVHMPKPDMMVMFGFEFCVLSIMSMTTAAKYALTLVELSKIREQKKKRVVELQKERIEDAKRVVEAAERRDRGEWQPSTGSDGTTEEEPPPSLAVARAHLQHAELPIDENEVEVEGWEAKGRYVFYLDLATDFFKLVVYLSFFVILLVFYGLPIHIMRDVFLTARSFFKRISDFLKYRTATRDMNERYADATEADIGREDVCIICREEMRPYQAPAPGQQQAANPVAERMRPKKLPCGHVLHFSCLRSWLERQQVCPTCRRPVIAPAGAAVNANGQPAAPGAQGGQHPRQGPRVFQFGPLRIGVGAARGNNMFEELQQQLQGRAPEAPRHDRNDRNGPQQYGFGIRWDGRTRRRSHRRRDHASLREQLDRVEHQIQEELRNLAQDTRDYSLLRTMQIELDRLRTERSGGTAAVPPVPTAPAAPVQQVLSVPPIMVPQRLTVNAGEHPIQAGSSDLPAGMTLPEGWSMTPLRPAPMPSPAMPHTPMPMQAGFPQPMQMPQPGPVPVPPHIRAMFSNMPGPTQHGPQPTQQQNQHQPNGQPPPFTPGAQNIQQNPATPQQSSTNGIHPSQRSPVNPPASSQDGPRRVNGDANEDGQNAQSQPLIPGRNSGTPFADVLRPRPNVSTPSVQDAATSTEAPQLNGDAELSSNHVTSEPADEPVVETRQHAFPSRTFGQPSPVTPRPLPMWGSGEDMFGPKEDERKDEHMEEAEVASLSQAASKQATVEDLAEGPD